MKKILLCLIPFLFIACASSRFESDFAPVYVTNTSKYAVLPVSAMSGSIDGIQRMTAHFGRQSFEFDVYVISDSKQLSMTILNEFGTTMGTLFYDGVVLDFDSALFPKQLNAEYIVADFQFCLYDTDALKYALGKIGVDFEAATETAADGTVIETRTLRKKGKLISKITRQSGTIHYENFLRSYSYTLSGVTE